MNKAAPLGTTYLVECFWPGVNGQLLAAAACKVAGSGDAVCLELILVPADEIVLCLFQAPSPAAVTAASRRAGISPERVIEAVRISPATAGRQPPADPTALASTLPARPPPATAATRTATSASKR